MISNVSKGLDKLIKDGKAEGRKLGKIQGKIEILIIVLNKKFEFLPQEYMDKIKVLPENVIETITTDIFDIEKVEDLEKYFKSK